MDSGTMTEEEIDIQQLLSAIGMVICTPVADLEACTTVEPCLFFYHLAMYLAWSRS